MKQITVERIVRPLRFAFLLPPEDESALRSSIQINTCLWGGRFNALIPVFSKTPEKWCAEHLEEIMSGDPATITGSGMLREAKMVPPGLQSLSPVAEPNASPSDIVRNYIDTFEPDYIVEMRSGLAAAAGISTDFVVQPERILPTGAPNASGLGVKVTELFHDLYEREFRFVLRHPRRVGQALAKDPQMSLFVSSCFGTFPEGDTFEAFRRLYRLALDAEDVAVDATSFLREQFEGPLRVGSFDLTSRGLRTRRGITLLLMDPRNALDIIDYWNLRALGWSVVPIPLNWSTDLVEPCVQLSQQTSNVSDPRGSLPPWVTILPSRSVSIQEAVTFQKQVQIAVTAKGNASPLSSFTLQWWFPGLSDAWRRQADGTERCDVVAEESTVECAIEEGRFSFGVVAPRFCRGQRHSAPGWANVIRLRDYSGSSEAALVVPKDLNADTLAGLFGVHRYREISVSSEGLVIRCRHDNWMERWQPPTGSTLFSLWLKQHGLTARLSDAGRITSELIRALGGLWGVRAIARREILDLLNRMAAGEAESEHEGNGADSHKKVIKGRSVPFVQWRNVLKRAFPRPKYPDVAADNTLVNLTNRGVIKLGLRLRCEICGRRNWYALNQLAEVLRCERCLRDFRFPTAKPPKESEWCYRTQGAFSVENYAGGAYTVALAIRFLSEALEVAQTSWVPACESPDDKGIHREMFDFAMLRRADSIFEVVEPTLIFGECKSFGDEFGQREADHARQLAGHFPGAILAFATLRSELKDNEKRLLKEVLASAPGSSQGQRPTLILVLTRNELMNDFDPPECWREAGGRFAKFVDHWENWRSQYGALAALCRTTQELYLAEATSA